MYKRQLLQQKMPPFASALLLIRMKGINDISESHFASGRFKWGKDTIELRDVTIRWEAGRMKKSEVIRNKPAIQLMQERYEYWERVPYPGLVIDNRPAITQVDIDKVGDYLIYLVRDPLGAYGEDPATRMAKRLENAECIGNSGMFLSYTGTYKGAKITCVSGGSGCPEVELAINDFMEYTDCSTFLRVGGNSRESGPVLPMRRAGRGRRNAETMRVRGSGCCRDESENV